MIGEIVKVIAGFLLWILLLLFMLLLGVAIWRAFVEIVAEICSEVWHKRQEER